MDTWRHIMETPEQIRARIASVTEEERKMHVKARINQTFLNAVAFLGLAMSLS